MNRIWSPVVFGLAIAALASATYMPRSQGSRGARLLQVAAPSALAPAARFDRSQSAALFVGVRKFTRDKTLDVPFAVDDAIDLAYVFALDPRVGLVPPERVVLALSGTPYKRESQRRLDELISAGAQLGPAEKNDILALLHQQAARAGRNGIFILALATHGFMSEGNSYVLGSSSLYRDPGTAISTEKMFDIVATTGAQRSLLFLDACRERITGARPDPQTTAPALDRMTRVQGQVVFYAATAGKWAYDGDGNGVFTKAVLDGLNCKGSSAHCIVTVESLRQYVEREVLAWIRGHRDPSIGAAIQVNLDGDTHNMPLANCCPPSP
ncbi:MAG TPA: caspase family protein [Thermoanaerobaculia bacterium]|nr:caspase family protein [Thermoanaerobaculia bacterium]